MPIIFPSYTPSDGFPKRTRRQRSSRMGTKHSRAKATALAAMVPLGMRRIRGKKDEIPEKTWEIPGKSHAKLRLNHEK